MTTLKLKHAKKLKTEQTIKSISKVFVKLSFRKKLASDCILRPITLTINKFTKRKDIDKIDEILDFLNRDKCFLYDEVVKNRIQKGFFYLLNLTKYLKLKIKKYIYP